MQETIYNISPVILSFHNFDFFVDAAIIFYIASKSEIAAEIFSIMAGDSFDTFSTRQDLSTIPICGVSTTESFESPVSDFF